MREKPGHESVREGSRTPGPEVAMSTGERATRAVLDLHTECAAHAKEAVRLYAEVMSLRKELQAIQVPDDKEGRWYTAEAHAKATAIEAALRELLAALEHGTPLYIATAREAAKRVLVFASVPSPTRSRADLGTEASALGRAMASVAGGMSWEEVCRQGIAMWEQDPSREGKPVPPDVVAFFDPHKFTPLGKPLPIRCPSTSDPCKACDGTGVVPFNRHGTMEGCSRCLGTGIGAPPCHEGLAAGRGGDHKPQEPHPCLYQSKVNGKEEYRCTCCVQCQAACQDDIGRAPGPSERV
jgi:hypothetical protein